MDRPVNDFREQDWVSFYVKDMWSFTVVAFGPILRAKARAAHLVL
jgi:phosphoribosyl-dephospho-CoA transferase